MAPGYYHGDYAVIELTMNRTNTIADHWAFFGVRQIKQNACLTLAKRYKRSECAVSLNNPEGFIHSLKDKYPDLYEGCIVKQMHPVHIAYALINHDVQTNGTKWNKCLDCGQPYIITGDLNFCSRACEIATEKYLGL
jgi:hypothetical protein